MYYTIYVIRKDGQFNTVFVDIMEHGNVLTNVWYDTVFRVLINNGGHFDENEKIVQYIDDRVAIVIDFV